MKSFREYINEGIGVILNYNIKGKKITKNYNSTIYSYIGKDGLYQNKVEYLDDTLPLDVGSSGYTFLPYSFINSKLSTFLKTVKFEQIDLTNIYIDVDSFVFVLLMDQKKEILINISFTTSYVMFINKKTRKEKIYRKKLEVTKIK